MYISDFLYKTGVIKRLVIYPFYTKEKLSPSNNP